MSKLNLEYMYIQHTEAFIPLGDLLSEEDYNSISFELLHN